jgi:uncharacterized protein
MAPMTLPLFPLGVVLYPGVVLPLHIFEDRYRRLVRDLLDMPEGSRLFGVVAIKAGREVGLNGTTALHEIGCTAELRYAEAYEDGQFDIIATGSDRFRLLEVDDSQPMQARIDLLPDEQSTESAASAARVRRLFVGYRKALLTAQGLPVDDDPLELPDDPTELGYLVAASMILDLTDKQMLLNAPTVDDRLRLERTLLKREAAMVSDFSMRPAVELPRLPYTSN